MKSKKSISLYPGGIINQNGNNMDVTLQGYGSVTPPVVLQEWINGLTQKQINEWADACDKWQEDRRKEGHKKCEWKSPIFKKKYRNFNPFNKPWEVEWGDWTGGGFKSFRTLEQSITFAKTRKDIFVDIKNEMT